MFPNLKYWWTRTSSCRPAWNYHWVHRFWLIDLGKTFKTWTKLADSGVECVPTSEPPQFSHYQHWCGWRLDTNASSIPKMGFPFPLPNFKIHWTTDEHWPTIHPQSEGKLSPQHFSPPSSQISASNIDISSRQSRGCVQHLWHMSLHRTFHGFVLFRIKYSIRHISHKKSQTFPVLSKDRPLHDSLSSSPWTNFSCRPSTQFP